MGRKKAAIKEKQKLKSLHISKVNKEGREKKKSEPQFRLKKNCVGLLLKARTLKGCRCNITIFISTLRTQQ